MKVHQLLYEEDETHFSSSKKLNLEFKDLAKKFDMTLVAGMGWPQIAKDGAWYGGGLGSHRGKSDEESVLGIAARRKGFLKALAKKLEELMASGRAVKIAAKAERSKHQEDAVQGQVEEQLVKHALIAWPPGNVRYKEQIPTIAWFVGADPSVKVTDLLSFGGGAYREYKDGARANFLVSLPEDEKQIKQVIKWLNTLQKEKKYVAGQGTTLSKRYADFVRDLLGWAVDHDLGHMESDSKRADIPNLSNTWMGIKKTRIVPKGTKVIPFTTIEPFLRKHGAI